MNTDHPNQGHYVEASSFTLSLGVSNLTTYVCADSQAGAEDLADAFYNLQSLTGASSCSFSRVDLKSTYSSNGDFCSPINNTQPTVGKPINVIPAGMNTAPATFPSRL